MPKSPGGKIHTLVLIKKGAEVLASLAYERDELGQLEAMSSAGLPGPEEEGYEYDEDNRLTKAGSDSFEYDPADNLVETPTSVNAYDKADQLETGTGISYKYDELGDRAKATPEGGPATSYSYNQAGVLTSVKRSPEGEVPGINEAFSYDGSGLIASHAVGETTAHLAWDESGGLPLLLNDGQSSYLYGPEGLPVESISSGEEPSYYHHDQLGSTRMLTDASGNVAATFTYSAYGQLAASTGALTGPLGFTGQYTLPQSELIYLRARAYDPATGQFMTRDPEEFVTRQPYAYAGDNPANLVDPLGLCGFGSIGDIGDCLNPASSTSIPQTAVHIGTDLAALPPYAEYYVPYKIGHAVNDLGEHFGTPGSVVSHALTLPLCPFEADGLAKDAVIDKIKGEPVGDEGKRGPVNPLHSFLPRALQGPSPYLPGIHPDNSIDFEW